jgi:hypothetical protein
MRNLAWNVSSFEGVKRGGFGTSGFCRHIDKGSQMLLPVEVTGITGITNVVASGGETRSCVCVDFNVAPA